MYRGVIGGKIKVLSRELYVGYQETHPMSFNEADWIRIPCGQCIGCRVDKSKNWALRCMHESLYSKDNWFITLTYADQPTSTLVSVDSGELMTVPELRKADLTKFIKDLRRFLSYHYNHDGVRFFACGEYGESGGRPHFHIIAFNCPLRDLEYFFEKGGNRFYRSETVERCWDAKGWCTISEMNFETCAYVARYVTKKITGVQKRDFDESFQIIDGDKFRPFQREYCQMSRRPGIGYQYAIDHLSSIYETDEVFAPKGGNPIKLKPPLYYDRLYDSLGGDIELIKESRRQRALSAVDTALEKTDLTLDEYLKVSESNFKDQWQKLRELKEL